MTEWTGITHLTRRDETGIVWRIRPGFHADVILTMRYRPTGREFGEISLYSVHDSADDAKRHVDDLLASWASLTIRAYEAVSTAIHNNDSQVGMF